MSAATETFVNIKAIFGDDKRRFKLPQALTVSFSDFRTALLNVFSLPTVPTAHGSEYVLRFRDSEDDWCTISCDEEWQEAVKHSMGLANRLLTVEVMVNARLAAAPAASSPAAGAVVSAVNGAGRKLQTKDDREVQKLIRDRMTGGLMKRHPYPYKTPIPVLPPVITKKTASVDDDDWHLVEELKIGQPSKLTATELATKAKKRRVEVPESIKSKFTSQITFYVNGQVNTISNVDPTWRTVDYLRTQCAVTGTKVSCGEGGCGACTIFVQKDDGKNGVVSFTAHACLLPVAALDGFSITTTEGIGSEAKGFHPIQSTLAECDGSQCGYCSPGFVMSMYGLLQNTPKPTMQQVEDNFDGHICRCTGYRSIYKAMHSFADPSSNPKLVLESDGVSEPEVVTDLVGPHECRKGDCCDIEDICDEKKIEPNKHLIDNSRTCGPKEHSGCGGSHSHTGKPELQAIAFDSPAALKFPEELRGYRKQNAYFATDSTLWFSPSTLADLYTLLSTYSESVVRLVAGNTAQGVAKWYTPNPNYDDPSVFIDLSGIPDLSAVSVQPNGMYVGAAVTITNVISLLQTNLAGGECIFPALIRHLGMVGNHQMRNRGSWAGNLMLHNTHVEFASDVCTIFQAAGITLTIASSSGTQTMDVATFLNTTLQPTQIILNMYVPFACTVKQTAAAKFQAHCQRTGLRMAVGAPQTTKIIFDTRKVGDRAQNTHALINAGFAFVTDSAATTITYANLVYGGVDATGMKVCLKSSAYLTGKPLNATTLAGVLPILQAEVTPAADPTDPNFCLTPAAYREMLSVTLFYKFFLTALSNQSPSPVPASLSSAATHYQRDISGGTEVYTPYAPEAPVGQPIHKLSAPLQASGEAIYTDDMFVSASGLHGAYVTSTVAAGTIVSIDATAALAMPGIVAFISAKDIVALNGSNNCGDFPGDEEIFASTTITHYGQPIGMILGDTHMHAVAAAKVVNIKCIAPASAPIFTIKDAIAANSYLADNQYMKHIPNITSGDPTKGFAEADFIYQGDLFTDGQIHFYMETQVALVVPDENDTLNIYTSSQGPAAIRPIVASAVGLTSNKVNVTTKRAGGGFGGKLSRDAPVAAAVAVCARRMRRPVRMHLPRGVDMGTVGKRHDHYGEYKVGVKKDGTVVAYTMNFYSNGGASYDATLGCMDMCQLWADNTYFVANYETQGFCMKTNLPPNTAMRAPGALNSIYMMEAVMERVAFELKMDPKAVREKNFYVNGNNTPYGMPIANCEVSAVWSALQTAADYPNRLKEVAAFNAANRWRKRGVRMTPVKYGIGVAGYQTSCLVNIISDDGTIQVCHSGTEIGQGINTKVAQAIAYALGVDISLINITANSTEKLPNFTNTGGSGTSEACCQAALNACATLNATLAPIKSANPKANWAQIIALAAAQGAPLSVVGTFAMPNGEAGGFPFTYFVYCAACSEVELDILTGQVQVLRTDIVYDGGYSLNYAIDTGQIEGAFIQGLGFFFTEFVKIGPTGRVVNNGTWDYKPPTSKDIPIQFNVTFLANDPNPATNAILSSKASGEPPYMMACSAFFAARDAVAAARTDAGLSGYFQIDTPATPDVLQMACGFTMDQLNLNAAGPGKARRL